MSKTNNIKTKGNFISSMKAYPNSLPIFKACQYCSGSGLTPKIKEGWYKLIGDNKVPIVYSSEQIKDTTDYKPCLIIY